MDPDKLGDLLRQRKLIEEHLRWLDGEIERARGEAGAPRDEPAAPIAQPLEKPQWAPDVAPHYVVDRKNIQREVARGCIFYLLGAIFLLFLFWMIFRLLP